MGSRPAHTDAEACRDRDGGGAVKDVVREFVRVAKQRHADAQPARHLELRPESDRERRSCGGERSARASLHWRSGPLRGESAEEGRRARTRRQKRPAPPQGTGVETGGIESERRCSSHLGKVRAPDVRATKDEGRRPRPRPIERSGHVHGDPGQDGGRRPEDGLSFQGNAELPPCRLARTRRGRRRTNRRWCSSLGGRTFAGRSGWRRRARFRGALSRALTRLVGALRGTRALLTGAGRMVPFRVGQSRSAKLGIQGHYNDERDTVRRLGASTRDHPARRLGGAARPENEIGDDSPRTRRGHGYLCRERGAVGDLDAGRARLYPRRQVATRGALGRSSYFQPDSGRRRLGRSVRRDGRALREERDQQGSARRHRADGSIAR